MQYLLEAIQAVPHINSLFIQRTLLTHIEKKKETGLRTLLLQFLLFYYLTVTCLALDGWGKKQSTTNLKYVTSSNYGFLPLTIFGISSPSMNPLYQYAFLIRLWH